MGLNKEESKMIRKIDGVAYVTAIGALVSALYLGSRGNGSSNPSYVDERVAFSTSEVVQVADGKISGWGGEGSRDSGVYGKVKRVVNPVKNSGLECDLLKYDVHWILQRGKMNSRSTIGELFYDKNKNGEVDFDEKRIAYTLELPFRGNEKEVSSIPAESYDIVRRGSKRFGEHFLVRDVPRRTDILIHAGNYPKDTHGCILVGESKGVDYVGSSRKILEELRKSSEGKKIRISVRD